MARTEVQAEASRRNGSRSQGPVTTEGKRRSSKNAIQHGGLAVVHTASEESTEIYADVESDLVTTLRPRNPIEADLVQTIAVDLVRSRRVTTYLEAAEELRLDELQDEDQDLREELLQLQTLKAEWNRTLPRIEDFEHMDSTNEVVEFLQKVGDLMEAGDAQNDPSEGYSTYYIIQDLRAVQEGFRTGITNYRPRWKKPLKKSMTQESEKLNRRLEALEARIQHRADLRERMARAIPDEKTLKLVSRYQATIDNALTRRLGVLKELRALGDEGSSTGAE